MLYILTGQDDFSLAKALAEIKKQIGDSAALTMSAITLDGKQVTPDELRVTCQTLPFLTGKRLVIVDGLLERFEPPDRSRRPARTAKKSLPEGKDQSDKHKPFVAAVSNLPESTILVLTGGKITAKNPLLKELASKAKLQTFAPIQGPKLRDWVREKATAEGGIISPKAVEMLARMVGSNLWTMAGEIDKLILFANGRRIEEEDVKTMVGYTQETTVFAMIDAVLESRAEAAEQTLQRLLQSGAAPAYLLSMLARQVQLIVRARELKSRKLPNAEIQSKLGLTNEFAFRKTQEQATRHSPARLREVYHHLLETDISIKTGQFDAELALTILVAELAGRSKAPLTQRV